MKVHELSIMTNILEIVVEYAQKNNAKKIRKINLRIGAMSDVIPEWAQNYFDMLSKDTIADKAELVIDRIPVSVKCRACGNERTLDKGEFDFICKKCSANDIELLTGRELSIISIEID